MEFHKDIKRKITINALICIYCFALVKPITPIVKDAVAHVFFKMEHLATVHFENGKYHIHAELAKASDQNETQNGTAPSSIFETLAFHVKNETFAFVIHPVNVSQIAILGLNSPVDICIVFPTPPPRV